MTTHESAVQYVWRRNTDREPSRWVWWVIGGLMALCSFGAFAAFMAEEPGEIPTFIGLGVIGSVLVWLIPPVYHWGRRRNPDITMEGREMVWAKKRVSIDAVASWSVRRQTSTVYNGTTTARMTVGLVHLQPFDGDTVTFTFPHLSELEVEELAAAIEPVLPGRRVE